MKVIPWERLKIDVQIKELGEDECKDITGSRTYRNTTDYKFYVVSKVVYGFAKIVQHIRLYSSSYGVKQAELLEDLYGFCVAINPLLTVPGEKVKDQKSLGAESCGKTESEQENSFEDITKEEILNLGDRVTEVVIGQDDPIQKVIEAIQRASAGLRDPAQPIGSFLLTGPTGVGKTYFAKVLAKELTGSEANLIRIDCSEYQQRHESAKLIGAPHGYVGFEKGGVLTSAIEGRPFAVVLFDEIEKAHDNVFNLLLQIMDEGILTANEGTKHSFSQAVILMTSNLGVKEQEKASKAMGFGQGGKLTDDEKIGAMELAVKKKFRPEFLNRLDAVSHFTSLKRDVCKHIVGLELTKLLAYLKENKNITVSYNQDIVDYIHDYGFDEEFGARPLRRTIRKDFANPLAFKVLMEEVVEGDDLDASMDDGRIVFK
jgi:ATP-dependent Clp protease ATP-binding subunit ClpC